MGAEQGVAEELGAVISDQLFGGDEGEDLAALLGLAVGAADLLGIEAGEAVVKPVSGEGLAGGALGLGEFVLVVGEHEVEAAAVDVEGVAEVFGAHGGALDVPAGAALAPEGIPHRFAGLGGLPEGEVGGVALAAAFEGARAGLLLVGAAVGELAVVGVLGDVEPDVAASGVSKALVDQRLGDPQDLRHVLGGLGKLVDRIDAERGEALVVLGGVALGQRLHGGPLLGGGVDQLVVHVGDVHDPGDVETLVDEVSLDRVKNDRADHVPDVRRFVDRRAAQVHPHLARRNWLEQFLLATQTIVNAQRHRFFHAHPSEALVGTVLIVAGVFG